MTGSPQDRESTYAASLAGDPAALPRLLAAYLPNLRAFVRARIDQSFRQRESCSDIVQSLCVDLLGKQPEVAPRTEAEFRGWLFTAALNKVREHYRFHHRERRDLAREAAPSDADVSAIYATLATPSRVASAREHQQRVEAALDRLSEDHREVICLARIADLPYREVAARMGRTVGAVQMLLGRALLSLAAELDKAGE